MGNKLGFLFGRFFDYPLKRKPICFYRQQDFSTTGEPLPRSVQEKETLSEYDKVVKEFYDRLLEKRRTNKYMQERNRHWSIQRIMENFPGWNELTISNLHSLFVLFVDKKNSLLTMDDFCVILTSLGDDSVLEKRKDHFDSVDGDGDGLINYNEFLTAIYTFDPRENGSIVGLALRCVEAAADINFVSNLTLGEQLEYGLF